MVTKLVSMPPSQRWLTYGLPARVASSAIGSWACFLVPTKRIVSPRATVSRDELERRVEAADGLGQVDDVDPVALREDVRAHLGVPAARLVAEVDAGLQQLAHRDGRHGAGDLLGRVVTSARLGTADRRPSAAGTPAGSDARA